MRKLFSSPGVREFLRIILAVLIALAIGFIITLLTSKDPIGAYKAFLFGPVSKLNRAGEWIKESITLMLLGLSVALVFKANLFSLGAEGQMLLAAAASGAVALYVPLPGAARIPLALAVAMLVGFLWGLIPGYLKAKLNANEIVSTLMLNAIALRFYDYLLIFHLRKKGAGYNATDFFPTDGKLGLLIPSMPTFKVSVMVYIAIVVVFIVWFIMFRTPFGYELRMLGVNQKFAAYGGVNVARTVILAFGLSGAVAGLAGAHLGMGVHNKLIMNITVSLGFEGIVVALLARNNPLAIPFSALAYGYIRAGADIMERSSDVSREMVMVIQAIIILLITAEKVLPVVRKRIGSTGTGKTDEQAELAK